MIIHSNEKDTVLFLLRTSRFTEEAHKINQIIGTAVIFTIYFNTSATLK